MPTTEVVFHVDAELTARAGLAPDAEQLFQLLCERRGWSDAYLAEINRFEHEQLKDLDVLIEQLHAFHESGAEITIAPDFDMDGISSGVLGYAGLTELGFQVNLQIPDYRRGHDLTVDDIREIRAQFPNTQALLTCDGGVNSNAGLEAAHAFGWFTMVTDHHQELEPGCQARITVNPCRIDETYSLRGICGAHVLYQVLEAYAARFDPQQLWSIRLLRLFAGLGTVSDVMPLLFENRQLVRDSLSIARLLRVPAPLTVPNRWGGMDPDADAIDVNGSALLSVLKSEPHSPAFVSALRGFALVLKAFAQRGKLLDVESLDEGFYGFYLAPAMNSPRRTGIPIDDCFTVFLHADPDEQLAAMHRVIENNNLRKELTIEKLEELTDGDQPYAPWVYFSDAYPGMFGLLASQMMRQDGHPVVVMNRPMTKAEPVSGSGRAPEWFEIITELENAGVPGLFAIGHQQACGVKLERAELLDDLVSILRDRTAALSLGTQFAGSTPADLTLGASASCDVDVEDTEPLMGLVRHVQKLKPFGQSFTEPMFELQLTSFRVDRIGSEKQHIRLISGTGLPVLWWNSVETHAEELEARAQQVDSDEPLRLLVKLQLNTFRDETRLQAVVETLL